MLNADSLLPPLLFPVPLAVVVEQLESKNKCPGFQGILPGMRLVEPKKSKEGSVIKSSFKSIKQFFKG